MRVDAEFLSTGTSMELDTRGREAALLALTLIREDRTPRGKCCVSSSSIRSHSSQVRVSRFMATEQTCCSDRFVSVAEVKTGSARHTVKVTRLDPERTFTHTA